jgi:AcrR family transcriptional regulator
MSTSAIGVRERTRRALRREIAEAAQRLFVSHGYEATTVDDIAAEVGMSPRSVFRYFSTKEDIVMGKLDFVGDEMSSALRSRPAAEPVWTSLRAVFEIFVPHVEVPGQNEAVEAMQRMVFDTPGLRASYLEKLHSIQADVEVAVRERATELYRTDDPTPSAIVAAAFGCMIAAQEIWLATGAERPFTEFINEAMAAVGPTDG